MIRKLAIIVSLTFIFLCSTGAYANNSKFDFKMGIGVESLKYEESLPDFGGIPGIPCDSEAKVTNAVLDIQAEYDFEAWLLGTKWVIPISKGDDTEDWTVLGIPYQTNQLEYEWLRWDIYAGYVFKEVLLSDTVEPYLGIRCSWAEQDRSNFVVLGVPVAGTATEEIDSYGLLLGLRAKKNFLDEKFTLGVNFEYVFPFDVEVTNSAIPGWSTDADDGYTYQFGLDGDYNLTEDWVLSAKFYYGKMHWDGSGWISYPGGSAKWPENDTEYLGGTLSVTYKF